MLSTNGRIRVLLLVLILFAGANRTSSAQGTQIPFTAFPPSATKITFETNPQGSAVANGTLAATVWAAQGVTFDGNDTVASGTASHSPPNALVAGPTTTSAIRATFSTNVSVVGAWGFDFVMEPFDIFGHSLGALTYTDGSAGLFGGAAEYGFLGMTSTTPIARVEFRHAFPSNQAFGFAIDDVMFVQGPPPPPRDVIAFSEFNEPALGVGAYSPGPAGEELGFVTTSTSSGGINPLVGKIALDGGGFALTHRSINATTTFDTLDLANYDDVTVFARVHVANTNYEASDLLRIYATNGSETVDLLNAVGTTALTNLAGDAFLTFGAAIPNSWTQTWLVMTSSSNSTQGSEHYDIDGIEFRGVNVVPEPASGTMSVLAIGAALGAMLVRRTRLGDH